jgi:prevent-host-death family protein
MAVQGVDLKEAGVRLTALVEQAKHGAEVVLTDRGEPVAKIIPISTAQPQREFGSARGLITMSDDFDEPLEDFHEYM